MDIMHPHVQPMLRSIFSSGQAAVQIVSVSISNAMQCKAATLDPSTVVSVNVVLVLLQDRILTVPSGSAQRLFSSFLVNHLRPALASIKACAAEQEALAAAKRVRTSLR